MAILDTLIAELLKDGVGKATGGKGIAKKLEEAITKESGKSSSPGGKETTKAEQKQAAAIRNAFTLGAPSDDRKAKARAMAAQAIFNDLERSKASPEELAAAKREADSWANWAAMPKATRENILSRGRRRAELETGTNKFGDVMNELGGTDEMGNPRNKGAAELLRREAVANAGGPRITGETITDGRVTNRQVTGKYGSGSVIDTGTRGTGDAALRKLTEGLLLDQAARGEAPPRYDPELAKYQSKISRQQQLMASLTGGTGAGARDGSYAEQVLRDYQSRITPQGAMPQQQVAQVPQYQPQQPLPLRMNFGESMDAYSILNAPTPTATPVAAAPRQPVAPVAVATPVIPVARTQAEQDEIDRVGTGFRNIGNSPAAKLWKWATRDIQ